MDILWANAFPLCEQQNCVHQEEQIRVLGREQVFWNLSTNLCRQIGDVAHRAMANADGDVEKREDEWDDSLDNVQLRASSCSSILSITLNFAPLRSR